MGGRRYNVVERRFLVIGERSGRVVLPGARFRGQGVGGFFDDLLGDGRRPLAADAPDRVVQVRAIPANAPQPWLPLTDLRLRYVALPHAARAGESATVQIEAIADGAVAAQMPELKLASTGAAQVFPDRLAGRRILHRRSPAHHVVAHVLDRAHARAVHCASIRRAWNGGTCVRASRAPPRCRRSNCRSRRAPAANANGAPDAGAPADVADATQTGDGRISIPGIQGRVLPWAAAAAAFALLWLFTLLWFLGRHAAERAHDGRARDARIAAPRPQARAGRRRPRRHRARHSARPSIRPPPTSMRCARASPTPTQRAALDALQRARWAGGDPRAAREALRARLHPRRAAGEARARREPPGSAAAALSAGLSRALQSPAVPRAVRGLKEPRMATPTARKRLPLHMEDRDRLHRRHPAGLAIHYAGRRRCRVGAGVHDLRHHAVLARSSSA